MPPLLKAIDPAVRPSVIALTPAGLPLTLGRWPFPIGTEPNNTSRVDGTFFTFKDPIISRVHTKFVFYPSDGTIRICDQKSTNGTIVNGIRIEPGQEVALKDGDEVAFGGGGGFYIGEFVGNPAAGTPYIYKFFLTDTSDQHGNKRQREDLGEPLYSSRPEQRRRLSNGGEGSSSARLAVTTEGSSIGQDRQDRSVSPRPFTSNCCGSAYNGSSLAPPPAICLESPPVDSEIQKELISPNPSTASTEHKENEPTIDGHQKLLSDLTSEFDCAICCNLMVAPHTVNPCGHMFCGLCLIGWFKLKSTCPECRADVSTSSQPMIPAFKMNTVIDMIAKSSLDDNEKLEHKKRASDWQAHLDEKRKIDEAAKKAKMNAPNPSLLPPSLAHGHMGMLVRQHSFMQIQPHQSIGDILRQQQQHQHHQRAQLMQEQMQEQLHAQTARVQAQAQILARQRAAQANLEGRVAHERRAAEELRTVAETARRFRIQPPGEDLTSMLRLPSADRFLGGRGEGSANPIDLTQSSDNDMNDEYSGTSESSDAEHDGPEIQSINIERARSGRSTCRTCRTTIANGELRWAVREEDTLAYYISTKFHHLGCYGVPTEYGFGADDVHVEAPAGMSAGESEAIRRALQA